MVFHSDRGARYASEQITAFAAAHGITRSMGRSDVCWDNALTESFFAKLKTEFYHRRVWPTKKRAKLEGGEWIEDATTGAAGTLRWVRSPRSDSSCDTQTRPQSFNKPHNPVSTNRGQGQRVPLSRGFHGA